MRSNTVDRESANNSGNISKNKTAYGQKFLSSKDTNNKSTPVSVNTKFVSS